MRLIEWIFFFSFIFCFYVCSRLIWINSKRRKTLIILMWPFNTSTLTARMWKLNWLNQKYLIVNLNWIQIKKMLFLSCWLIIRRSRHTRIHNWILIWKSKGIVLRYSMESDSTVHIHHFQFRKIIWPNFWSAQKSTIFFFFFIFNTFITKIHRKYRIVDLIKIFQKASKCGGIITSVFL